LTPYGARRQLLPIFENSPHLGACQAKGCASFHTLATKATNVTSMAAKSTGRGNDCQLANPDCIQRKVIITPLQASIRIKSLDN